MSLLKELSKIEMRKYVGEEISIVAVVTRVAFKDNLRTQKLSWEFQRVIECAGKISKYPSCGLLRLPSWNWKVIAAWECDRRWQGFDDKLIPIQTSGQAPVKVWSMSWLYPGTEHCSRAERLLSWDRTLIYTDLYEDYPIHMLVGREEIQNSLNWKYKEWLQTNKERKNSIFIIRHSNRLEFSNQEFYSKDKVFLWRRSVSA